MTLPFTELDFDAEGNLATPLLLDCLIAECGGRRATDLIFLAHGFRCSIDHVRDLYAALLANLSPNLVNQAGRTFAVSGVYWPSQKFRESFGTMRSVRGTLAHLRSHNPVTIDHAASLLGTVAGSRSAQDQFAASVLSAFDNGSNDPAEGLPLLHQLPGSELFARLSTPTARVRQDDVGGIENRPIMDPVLNGIDAFLNFMTWSAMKNLSGKVGTNGLAPSVLAVRRRLGDIRIHLVGHSLGARLVTACCKALGQEYTAQVDSLSLLEGAFSHFGFSPDAGWGEPGFFRNVIETQIVRGPMISTFSKQDAVVGKAYAVASRLTGDRLQAIGDACDPYGGIGHNGAQRTPESTVAPLRNSGETYRFRPGIVTCLDGSAGLITGHGDITNPAVTYAIASAICQAA